MPRVPTLDGPQLQRAQAPTPYQGQFDATADTRGLAAGLDKVAGALQVKQQRDDQDLAFSTDAKLKGEWLDYESKLRESRRGRDAAGYTTEVEQWWKDAGQRYGQGLTPGAARLVNRSLVTSQLQAQAGAQAYQEQQLNASADASYKAAQAVSISEAATVGTEQAAIKALADMQQKRADRARLQGWTPEQVTADALNDSTQLHTVMVSKLARQDPAAAQVYFDKYKSEIGAQQQAALEGHLQQTSAALDGNTAATEIWQSMGPKADGQPVELDKMEAAARDKYKNDPTRQKNTIAEIQQRAAAFNSGERERTAAGVNTVMAAYSKGASLAQLQSSLAFQSLPGEKRAQIQDHIRDRNHMLWAQSVEDRARLDREQQQKTFPAFLQYSDPSVLSTMTRAEVTALQPSIGNQLTEHLVSKWDALQKPQAKLEARMDTEDFNHIADQLGLDPYRANTEDKKRQLGELKYRVEQLINVAQVAKKGPLTRDEKNTLMTEEMSRTVTVGGFFSNSTKPVIQLKSDELRDVIVPETDRAQIAAALKQMYGTTKDPLYAPTEDNMRRLYLQHRSRAAALIPPAK